MTLALGNGQILSPLGAPYVQYNFGTATSCVIDGATKRVAFKFKTGGAITITAINARFAVTGSPVANLIAQIETDSSDTPSGVLVGTATAAFAGPVASGWTGEKALGSSASLSANTSYWLVIKVDAVTTLDASNLWTAQRSSNVRINGEKVKASADSGVTYPTSFNGSGCIILVATGVYYGYPIDASIARSAQNDIFSTNRQGLRFKLGAPATLLGFLTRLNVAGTPSTLLVKVFTGDTESATYQTTIALADIETGIDTVIAFAGGASLPAGTYIYIILSQTADGGTDANDYDLYTWAINSSYVSAVEPTDWRFVAGASNTPSSLTVVTGELPYLFPILTDPATEITSTGSTNIFMVSE